MEGTRGGAIGARARRRIAGRCAGHGSDFRTDLVHHRDEHGHAQILKGSGVRRAALLDSDFATPNSLASASDRIRGEFPSPRETIDSGRSSGSTTSFLDQTPLSRPIRAVEEFFHSLPGRLLKGRDVMTHLEQAAASGTSIKDFLEGIADTTPGEAFKPSAQRHRADILNHLRSGVRLNALQDWLETPG